MTIQATEVGVSQEEFEAAASQVEKNTAHLYPLWMNNWRMNLNDAAWGMSLDKIYSKGPVERALVIGRGPSLFKHKHLELLAEKGFKGTIVASDGVLKECLDRGVTPHYSMTVDGSPVISKWYRHDKASESAAILPVTVHPSVKNECKARNTPIYWYIPELDMNDNDGKPLVKGLTDLLQLQTYTETNPTGLSRANGAGNCGLAAIVLSATILRAKETVLIGMDNGYRHDTPLSELHYHRKLLEACGLDEEKAAKLYKIYHVAQWDEYCIVDPVFQVYLNTYNALSKQISGAGVKIYNCTEGGCLVANATCLRLEEYLDSLKGT